MEENKYLEVKCDRLYKNPKGELLVDARDFEVKKCIKDKMLGIIFIIPGEVPMTLSRIKVKTKIVHISEKRYPTQVPGNPDYKLYSYKYVPDEQEAT